MKRNDLNEVVRMAAEELGYVFYTGEDAVLAAKTKELPAVWMAPMTLKTIRGRKERRDTYSLRVRFLSALPAGFVAEGVRAILEADASALADYLQDCRVVRSVGGLKVTPQKTSLTPAGEISVVAEFDVQTSYYRY